MSTEKIIRNEARSLLSNGKWSTGISVFLIFFAGLLLVLFFQSFIILGAEIAAKLLFSLFSRLIDSVPAITGNFEESSITHALEENLSILALGVGFLLLFPLYCGVKRYFYFSAKGVEASVSDVFYYLTVKLKKSLLLGFRFGILCVLKLLLCLEPTIILFNLTQNMEFSTLENSLITLSFFVTAIAGLFVWVLWTSKHFLTIYLFIEDDSQPVGFYPRESCRLLSGGLYKSVRKLIYSFWGWFIFGLTGVGLLYFCPYLETSLACSAKWLIKLDKEVC